MRVLVLHNRYRQPGGEDRVFEAETALLEAHGHEVIRFVRDNTDGMSSSPLRALGDAAWNRSVAASLREVIAARRPDVAHVHNVFAVLSPAVYRVLWQADIPVVQTLHNYRLACPSARLFRDGRFCDLCRGRGVAWPAVRYGCYQDRRSSSLAMVLVLTLHRVLGTWRRAVDLYVAPSAYVRRQMIPAGLPGDRITVRPHFVPDPGQPATKRGDYALFIGRIEEQKGIRPLLDAWRRLPGHPLKIVGQGPLVPDVQRELADPALSHVSLLGWMEPARLGELLARARFVVIPSRGPESFGLTAIEAFSHGAPVLASTSGALPELVHDVVNGLTVEPCEGAALAAQARRLFEDHALVDRLSARARTDYLKFYSPEIAGRALPDIYERAVRIHRARQGSLHTRD